MTARTRCWWAKVRECDEVLYGRRVPLKVKGAVHKLCQASNTVWKRSMVPERDGNVMKDRKIHGGSNVWITANR